MHVDTGAQLPRGASSSATARVEPTRRPAGRRPRCRTSIDAGRVVEETGPQRQPQPAADHHAARRHRGAPLRRRVRRRPARRGEGPGQGAGLLASATSSASGTRRTSAPSCGRLYNGRHQQGEHIRVFPLSNWTELDIWQYIADEDIELPSIYYAHRREVFRRDGMLLAVEPVRHRDGRRGAVRGAPCGTAPSATRRAPARSSRRAATVDEVIAEVAATRITERGATRADDRASRSRHGRPQERGVLLSAELLRFATAGSVDDGKSHAHRSAALRLEGDLRGPARGGRAHEPRPWATSTPTWRCSPTACGPSASRASRSTSPTATSPRRSASSSSPTRPGHIQYTRNMVTGASTADLALVLVDARNGIARAVAAPRLPRVAAAHPAPRAVRQQDGPRRLRPDRLRGDQGRVPRASPRKLDVTDLTFIPISALNGDNVVNRSRQHAVVRGLVAAAPPRGGAHRVRPQPHRRPLPGAVRDAAAERRVPRLPGLRRHGRRRRAQAGRRGRRAAVGLHLDRSSASTRADGPVDEAFAPMSVTITLDRRDRHLAAAT